MRYWGEIRAGWRFLLAASIGQAAGYSIVNYLNNLFTPHLIKQFDWSRSEFAFVGVLLLLGILVQPLTGRMADLFGVRRVAALGVITSPLVFIGLSLMTGNLWQFVLLNLTQIILVSGTTGPVTYSRLIAQQFNRARGTALAIAACAPPAVAALCVSWLSRLIEASGWRAGYTAVAAGTAIAGVSAILLIPATTNSGQIRRRLSLRPSEDYKSIIRSRAFQLIAIAIFLCNLSFTMQTSQLKLVLLDRGIDSVTGSIAISLFASSVLVGRLLCGLALDRFPAYAVSVAALGLPGLGLCILGSGISAPLAIDLAVSLLGLSLGGEGDVMAYLVTRYFKPEIYGTVYGMVLAALATSVAFGALFLSFTLRINGTFTLFLLVSGAAVLIGSGMLSMLKREPTVR